MVPLAEEQCPDAVQMLKAVKSFISLLRTLKSTVFITVRQFILPLENS
jgi:hypothetical protein